MTGSNPGTTVVLGWDGLDATLLQEFGLTDAFGEYVAPIKTYRNEHIGEPHTREIWPTMITGVGPDEHGIWAAEEESVVKWSNPAIRQAARVADVTVPDSVTARVGRWLRSRGAEVEKYDAAYYDAADLWTVFDDRRALPIAVPNYRTRLDDRHGYMFDRGAELSAFLDRGPDGWLPAGRSQQATVEQEMAAEAGAKRGLVETALSREYDLVWAWFGIVDTAGHVEPAARDPIQRRAYEQAVAWTDAIRRQLALEDRLVVLSDHGLRDGHHTMDAVVASDDAAIVDQIGSVFDVADMLDDVTPTRSPADPPPLRTGASPDQSTAAGGVREHLEHLGYV